MVCGHIPRFSLCESVSGCSDHILAHMKVCRGKLLIGFNIDGILGLYHQLSLMNLSVGSVGARSARVNQKM